MFFKHACFKKNNACCKPETPWVGLGDNNPYKNIICMPLLLSLLGGNSYCPFLGDRKPFKSSAHGLLWPAFVEFCLSLAFEGHRPGDVNAWLTFKGHRPDSLAVREGTIARAVELIYIYIYIHNSVCNTFIIWSRFQSYVSWYIYIYIYIYVLNVWFYTSKHNSYLLLTLIATLVSDFEYLYRNSIVWFDLFEKRFKSYLSCFSIIICCNINNSRTWASWPH